MRWMVYWHVPCGYGHELEDAINDALLVANKVRTYMELSGLRVCTDQSDNQMDIVFFSLPVKDVI